MTPPSRYDNPHRDDPWDNDAVRWLMEQEGGEGWSYRGLLRALRRQPSTDPARVTAAEALAVRHGVVQRHPVPGTRPVIHLQRTDRLAPEYPAPGESRRG